LPQTAEQAVAEQLRRRDVARSELCISRSTTPSAGWAALPRAPVEREYEAATADVGEAWPRHLTVVRHTAGAIALTRAAAQVNSSSEHAEAFRETWGTDMSTLPTKTTPDTPMTLAVKIDARRSQLPWNNASPAAAFDFDDRFEDLDNDGSNYVHDDPNWHDVDHLVGVLRAIGRLDLPRA
jgi:hypothetical protein